jgi:hypothetical protein
MMSESAANFQFMDRIGLLVSFTLVDLEGVPTLVGTNQAGPTLSQPNR